MVQRSSDTEKEHHLHIIPGTRRREDPWHTGHVTQGTCMHGDDPPRSTADFGSNDEKVADIVRIVGQELVEVEPPNKRHDIKGMATRHLPHIRPELISSAP